MSYFHCSIKHSFLSITKRIQLPVEGNFLMIALGHANTSLGCSVGMKEKLSTERGTHKGEQKQKIRIPIAAGPFVISSFGIV